MPRVRLYFGLRARDGSIEFNVPPGKLCDVLRAVAERVEGVVRDCEPAPGILVFIDDVDARLLDKHEYIRDDAVIAIVPVNHPG